ncbi:hypothetical protein RZ87_14860 [Enterobacter roggenkampii]|nr:hypothetical protein RZ87_14860 [Enterobacter roggenkampii]
MAVRNGCNTEWFATLFKKQILPLFRPLKRKVSIQFLNVFKDTEYLTLTIKRKKWPLAVGSEHFLGFSLSGFVELNTADNFLILIMIIIAKLARASTDITHHLLAARMVTEQNNGLPLENDRIIIFELIKKLNRRETINRGHLRGFETKVGHRNFQFTYQTSCRIMDFIFVFSTRTRNNKSKLAGSVITQGK